MWVMFSLMNRLQGVYLPMGFDLQEGLKDWSYLLLKTVFNKLDLMHTWQNTV